MKWYPTHCRQCQGDGFHMEIDGPQICGACRGMGRPLMWQTILPGSLIRMCRASQPAILADPYNTILGHRQYRPTRAEEGSTALVVGDRLHEIDKEGPAAKNQAWQGHDVLCIHVVYGLCWLALASSCLPPSSNMEVISDGHQEVL
jgi:hypothetical protein